MGGSSSAWAERVLQLLSRMNSFHMQGSSKALCRPFYVASHEVGVVQPRLFPLLSRYPEVFHVSDGAQGRVELSSRLCTYEQRSGAIERTLTDWRQEELFSCLRSWRNEKYQVMQRFSDTPLLGMERSAIGLFGVKSYGVHVNGYVRHGDGLSMWIGRRTHNKETFPGRLDNLVAGGLGAGFGVKETLIKECAEEACIPESIAEMAKPAGTISYTYEDEWGVFPECQFVYDLEVPVDFVPKVGDGEVLEFYLWPLEQVREAIAGSDFKPNCAMVVLDFLIRHGTLDADDERCYQQFMEGLHREL
ncbi:thiamin pyrophosphokinase 2 isoform X2 [Heterodontus francisci]|uniref:thiamin pyrophosphokinase 2 isoform X2 n=1 Tax=Heterodontus francisci TaxID=7792 RepID=UPI00355B83E7